MELLGLINKNKYLVIQTVFAFLICFLATSQNFSKPLSIIGFCYIFLLTLFFVTKFYKNKASYVYSKEDSDGILGWKYLYKLQVLLSISFSFITAMEVFNLHGAIVYFHSVYLVLIAIFEVETILLNIMFFLKWKSRYLHIFLGIVFITLLNNTNFINLLFGSVGILFVAQYLLSDNFTDYLKYYYSKYDLITIKRYIRTNKSKILASCYLVTFSVNVIFGIKNLLPSYIKEWIKTILFNFYNQITTTNDHNDCIYLIFVNIIILGIITLFYILLDRFLKGKFKKKKASILKHMRENLQEKKVGNSHG